MQKDLGVYRILLVEDNPGDALLISDYLREYIETPEISLVNSMQAAREVLLGQEGKTDLILLDLTLPDAKGVELVRGILRLAGKAPIVVLTGYGDYSFSLQSLKMGVSDYYLKDELTPFALYKSIVYNIERKRNYEALKRSEKRHSDLFHFSPQPMCVYNGDTGDILDANRAAIKAFGYSEAELVAMQLSDLWAADIEKVLDMAPRANEGNAGLPVVRMIRRKDGQCITVEVYSNRIDFDDSDLRIVLTNDITQQLAHLKAIEEQNERLREIAWTQSHEVRAPLARLMGLVTLFQDEGTVDSDERSFYLSEIQNSARELDKLILQIITNTEEIDP